jgi:dihydroorotate dehydrogenase electron transfer subunit
VAVVELASVAAVQPVTEHLTLLHLDVPAVAALVRPGQFVMVQCAEPDSPAYDPFLPRPYFVFAADAAAGRASVLVRAAGRGSAWLARRRAGDRVRLHGPAGREIRPARLTRHLLLMADGPYALPAVAFLAADAARRGRSVTVVENVPPSGAASPAGLLPLAVEYQGTTPAAGGLLGALPALLKWADEIVVAADPALLDTLAALRRARLEPFTLYGNLPIQAIPLPCLAAHGAPEGADGVPAALVPCGTGACGACTIRTADRQRLFCRDGPAFPLETLRFDLAPADDDVLQHDDS